MTATPLKHHITGKIQVALKQILHRNLYQSAQVDETDDAWAESYYRSSVDARSVADCKAIYSKVVLMVPWRPCVEFPGQLGKNEDPNVWIKLEPIEDYCPICKKDERTFSAEKTEIGNASVRNNRIEQSWMLSYKCAKCESHLSMLVYRRGGKLILAGRYPSRHQVVCKDVPENMKEYISKALIASETGFVLAGFLYLRVAIEQFFLAQANAKQYSGVADGKRPTGEDLGDFYNSQSPPGLRDNFPSLKEQYSKLSGAIHSASVDISLFKDCLDSIYRHFQARTLLKLDEKLESETQERG